jgi:hypothetical protein
MNLECEHGQLARSCNICEYEREIAELTARVGELEMERGHQEAAIAALEEANNSLAARVGELEAWKESALAIENLWDVQAVGREIGVDLGESIRSQILPYIKRLKATLKNIR